MTTKCFPFTDDDKPCSSDSKIDELCTQHVIVKKTLQNIPTNDSNLNNNHDLSIIDNGDYIECIYLGHHSAGSKYPRNKVPIISFRKVPSDSNSLLLKTCLDCRQYQSKIAKNRQMKLKKYAEDQKNVTNSDVRFCTHRSHNTISSSIYERDKVPILLFRKEPDNPKSSYFETCLDCRNLDAEYSKKRIANKKICAEKEGKFFCTQCHNTKPIEERAKNLDDTLSILCLPCKDIERSRSLDIRQCYDNIKLEFILKFQCSCQKCKCIYLKLPADGFIPIKLPTYETDGKRWVNYDGQSYCVDIFLTTFKDLLEVRIIQLDHLTEKEQGKEDYYFSVNLILKK